MAKSQILNVPYFPQYNYKTCQTAVLKMYAEYLIKFKGIQANKSVELSIDGIREKLEAMGSAYSHQNWMTWMKLAFNLEMESIYIHHEFTAVDFLVSHLDHNYPVIASVSHANNTGGHIILIFGYEQKKRNNWIEQPETIFHVHDPYGKYDPMFNGKRNIDFGPSPNDYLATDASKKKRLAYRLPRNTSVLLPSKGEDLKMPVTSIRRNYSKEKRFRFRRYELISVKTK